MHKLTKILLSVILICLVTFFNSCGYEKKVLDVKLTNKEFSTIIPPDDEYTSACTIEIVGNSDCDLVLSISGGKGDCIKSGKVKFFRQYEWYYDTKHVRIISDSSCTHKNTELKLKYEFSRSLFGNGATAGGTDCN